MRTDFLLSDDTIGLIREIAGKPADDFCSIRLIPQLSKAAHAPRATEQGLADALRDPIGSLRALLGYYAFSRRGKDRKVYAAIAEDALNAHLSSSDAQAFLEAPNASGLWGAFEAECERQRKKANPDLNIGVVAGLAEMAQEVYRQEGRSIAAKAAEDTAKPGQFEEIFLRLVDIRGVGPKLASTILRDFVWVLGAEDGIHPKDAIYAQPIDRWLRRASGYILQSDGTSSLADWVLAGKIGRAARLAGVSPIRLNMGVEGIGMSAFSWNDPDDWFDQEMANLRRNGEAAREQSAIRLT